MWEIREHKRIRKIGRRNRENIYTFWFEENLLPNIFWENIFFDLKKIKKEWRVKHKR